MVRSTFKVCGQNDLHVLWMKSVKDSRAEQDELVQIVSRLVVVRQRTQELKQVALRIRMPQFSQPVHA